MAGGRMVNAQAAIGSDDDQRLVQLKRMKAIATALLVGSLLLVLLAHWLHDAHPLWPFVAAFAEAATVGAMADWFAVVALFRHPLGLPIWHTAIIPRNKSRIARNLGSFVVEHFFTPAALLPRLAAYNPAQLAGNWLSRISVSPRLARLVADAMATVISSLDDDAMRRHLAGGVRSGLMRIDMATLGGRVLDGWLAGERQHELLDTLFSGLGRKLEGEAVRERLVALLTESLHLEDVKVMGMSLGSTLRPLARSAAERLIQRLQAEMSAAASDPAHPWREMLDVYLHECALRLKADPRWRARVTRSMKALLSDPVFDALLDDVWASIKDWVLSDVRAPDSRLVAAGMVLLRGLGERLMHDARMQGRLNRRLMALLPSLVERYRPAVAIFISDKLDSWSKEEVSERIELAIGHDLQFIRINGTLVGGVIGLCLYSFSRLFYS
ncbi:DUF445 domain-containing protein [Rhodobacteraceae bacterium CH30]|nr:DUF445 domain-containing protein [Rhodobacteraceae bacterium CH30]